MVEYSGMQTSCASKLILGEDLCRHGHLGLFPRRLPFSDGIYAASITTLAVANV